MFVAIINDCRDADEMGRQTIRASVLFPGTNINFLGVGNFNEIEAAGLLVDSIDAAMDSDGVIMVNAAPRHGSGKDWDNGTPFGYFKLNNIIVVSTIAGMTLSLVKKLGCIDRLNLTDLSTVIDHCINIGKFDKDRRDRTVFSQFRSFEYMPFLAKWLHEGQDISHKEMSLDELSDPPKTIWWVDNFGNVKTTLLPEEIDFEPGKKITTKVGVFTCYNRLKDVPNGDAAITIGSSGYKDKRFIEITINGRSAAKEFNLHSGMELF